MHPTGAAASVDPLSLSNSRAISLLNSPPSTPAPESKATNVDRTDRDFDKLIKKRRGGVRVRLSKIRN